MAKNKLEDIPQLLNHPTKWTVVEGLTDNAKRTLFPNEKLAQEYQLTTGFHATYILRPLPKARK